MRLWLSLPGGAFFTECIEFDIGAGNLDREFHLWLDSNVQSTANFSPESRAVCHDPESLQWLFRIKDSPQFITGIDYKRRFPAARNYRCSSQFRLIQQREGGCWICPVAAGLYS